MQEKFKKNRKKGFSLMEVLLVVFILSTALMVFIQVISQSIVHSIGSQDTIIAASLAQEGVELIKNIRDNNWANNRETFDSSFFPSSSECEIDSRDPLVCSFGTGNYNLNFNGGFYTHGPGEKTKFLRKITINTVGEKKEVTSFVVWSRSDFPTISDCVVANRCVYATVTLTKWGE